MDDEDALHLQRFHWFPPGDFTADWLTAAAKKLVKKGAEKELEGGRDPLFPTEELGVEDASRTPSTIEQRLSALRGPGRRVSFAERPTVVSASRQAEGRKAARDGAGGGHRALAPVVAPPLAKVKDEEAQVISDSEQSKKAAKKAKKRSLATTLAKAAKLRNAQEEKEEQKNKRSRSRSPGKKKKKKRKKRSSDSEESGDSPGHSSSSEASLMAPLKKRSRKSPGSVYRMPEETAVERLSADGVVEEGYEAAGLRGQRPKMLTFFQLVLRPALDPRSRDCKELSLLSRSLDLLREGRLAELADVLASRLIAVDTAGRQGWHVARHLEVYGEEEENSVPPPPRAARGTKACTSGRQGRGKGLLEPSGAVELPKLGVRAKAERKRKGNKRKRQEGQRKRQKLERRLERVATGGQRQAERSEEEGRRGIVLGMPGALVLAPGGPCTWPQEIQDGGITQGTGAEVTTSLSSPMEGAIGTNSTISSFPEVESCHTGESSRAARPTSRAEWLLRLTEVSNLVELGGKLAWGLRAGFLSLEGDRARPTQGAASSRGSLFPLPILFPEGELWLDSGGKPLSLTEAAVQCWVAVGCAAMNSLYGHPKGGMQRKPGKMHEAVLASLRVKVRRFLEGEDAHDFSFGQVVKDLGEKKVSYCGEEVLQPHPLSPEQIVKGLPPPGHGGSISVLPFLKGRTKFLMEHPSQLLLEEGDRGSAPVSARVHIEKGLEPQVFGLLYDRGIIDWVPAETAFSDSHGTYLSGLFGVAKAGKFTSSGKPVLRVIMNLIPINGLFRVLQGDVGLLPSATGWLPICMSQGEEITISQSDMTAAFYLFSIPDVWKPYMCFNYRIRGSDLGLSHVRGDRWYRPACRVLPMGWSSSVSVTQAVSREILLSRGLPPGLELKKGSPPPPWFAQVQSSASSTKAWWQIYLDNFMAGDLHKDAGALDEDLQALAMNAWTSAGILTAEDKQVLSSASAVELGVRIDGRQGLLGASPGRLLKTIFATLYLLGKQLWSRKETQIVLGRWVFILQFRRAAMGMLSKSWQVIESHWPSRPKLQVLQRELMGLICLGPLLQADLRAVYDGQVTVSDASESGGACAVATGLTWSGRSLVGLRNDLRLAPLDRPLLVISLFNGIGGAFRLYDILGIVPAGRISVDISRTGNRVSRSAWPDMIELHDVELIDLKEVERWAGLFPHVVEVHMFAGFPCVHLSSARAFRQNLEGDGSRLFWKLLEVIQWVQQVFSVQAKVKWCVENVASMDETARQTISSELEVSPIKLDPSNVLPYSRPRFAWSSETLFEMEGLQLWTEKEYVRAYMSGPGVENHQWIRPGWTWEAHHDVRLPTFMKSIKRSRPPPAPAGLERTSQQTQERWRLDQFRYPPYQYEEQFLLHQVGKEPRLLDSSEREILLGFGAGHTATCMSASEAKKNWRDYEDARCSLCGDSFSIPSFAVMASQMACELAPRMPPAKIIARLGLAPGCSAHPSVDVPMSRLLSYGGDADRPCWKSSPGTLA